MLRFIAVMLAVAFAMAVHADASQGPSYQLPPTKLLQRVLQEDERQRPARPIGQCVFACGDQLIELDRCPNGECPEFDCRSRAIGCPTR